MDFDETRLYYSYQQLQIDPNDDTDDDRRKRRRRGGGDTTTSDQGSFVGNSVSIGEDEEEVEEESALDNLPAVRRHFREFLRNYRLGTHRFVYREKLMRIHHRLRLWSPNNANDQNHEGSVDLSYDPFSNPPPVNGSSNNGTSGHANSSLYSNNACKLEVDLAHIGEYHAALLGHILHQPSIVLPCLEHAAADALETLSYDVRAASHSTTTAGTGTTNYTRTTSTAQEEAVGDHHHNNNNNQSTRSDNLRFSNSSVQIQVLLVGNLQPTALRSIKSEHMNRLLKCPGIIISASPVKNRAVQMTVQCWRCLDKQIIGGSTHNNNNSHSGNNTGDTSGGGGPFGSMQLPIACSGVNETNECGRFPYSVVPDESLFVDQQTLKLQEAPEQVPTGEMPRSVMLAVERTLVDVAPPGTRVSVFCIPTLFSRFSSSNGKASASSGHSQETKSVYLRVVGLERDNDSHGSAVTFTPAEEEAFQTLSSHPDVYNILSRSIAPNISGAYTVDIKKSLTCQLFGGSRKKLPDGVRLRGDINVLLLGDPSMAKSQFLKFISKVAPVGIYTSGKGSSAAGLTASVVKDAKGEFYLEGGAMVLADGGIVCIDEFDKMRPNDRVAIHEAMEQQTISVAKAGITTVLNSRSSVLAAANPVFGRYDDLKSASENIDLMTTILSRFDLIFLVRDIREEERDRMICQHVMGVHINSSRSADGGLGHGYGMGHRDASSLSYRASGTGLDEPQENSVPVTMTPDSIAEHILKVASTGTGELEVQAMKKYIQYSRAKCCPFLGEEAGQVLVSSYVKIRDNVRKASINARGSSSGGSDQDAPITIPVTVRQLEALVRLSESLARMRLDNEVRSEDVTEALRLFQVSTMAANAADQISERSLVGGSTRNGNSGSESNHLLELERTEAFLRSRLQLGSLVNKLKIVEEASGQGFNVVHVTRVLAAMASRGEIFERNQGRLLKRIK